MTWPVTINSLPPNPLNIHKAADLRLISNFRQPFFQNKSSQRAHPNLETQIGLSPQKTYDWFLIETLRPSCFGSISTRPPQKLYSSRIPKMENARLLKRRSGRGAWSYKYYEQFQIATCFVVMKRRTWQVWQMIQNFRTPTCFFTYFIGPSDFSDSISSHISVSCRFVGSSHVSGNPRCVS